MPKLTERQHAFVLEYVRLGNAAEAARRVGYAPKSARSTASRLLTNGNIRAVLTEVVTRHLATLDLDLARIIQEAARVGISDMGQLFDEDGHLIPTHLLPVDVRRAIASVKVTQSRVDTVVQDGDEQTTTRTTSTETVEYRFWDKLKGLELIGKFKGYMKPQVVLEAGDSWHDVLVRMTEAQAKAKLELEEKIPPKSSTVAITRAVGTGHQGHHGGQER